MVTSIHSLFDRATADIHMYDGGGASSFDSHFANISDWHIRHIDSDIRGVSTYVRNVLFS